MNENTEDHIPLLQIRPRFQIDTDKSKIEIEEALKEALSDQKAPCRGQVGPGFATLYMPHEVQHYWSPQLTVSIEENEDGVKLYGLFGPRPAVWTLFVFFYAIIAFGILVISVIGFSNMSLDRSGSILWFIPFLLLAFLTLYIVAYFGKKLGHDEIRILHRFFEKSTGLEISHNK